MARCRVGARTSRRAGREPTSNAVGLLLIFRQQCVFASGLLAVGIDDARRNRVRPPNERTVFIMPDLMEPEAEPSITKLMTGIVQDARHLFMQQLTLFQVEIRHDY